jgi:hypothetical protein
MYLRRMRRNKRSDDKTSVIAGLEVLGGHQSTERATEASVYPAHLNSFVRIHELKESQAPPPPLLRQSTFRDISNCL